MRKREVYKVYDEAKEISGSKVWGFLLTTMDNRICGIMFNGIQHTWNAYYNKDYYNIQNVIRCHFSAVA